MARVSSGYAIAMVLGTLAMGCFDLSDSRGPTLSVELCWDEQPGDGFTGKSCVNKGNVGTCDSAGVDTMTWTLKNSAGKTVANSGDNASCANALDIIEPSPGEYSLQITGTDSNGNMVWQHTCKSLDVLRFDIDYECDVDAP